MDTKRQEWAKQCRQAWRQVHQKQDNRGHLTRGCPWTWQEFRLWFRGHLEVGVALDVHHLNGGEWKELLQSCKRGMLLPRKAPF